MLKLLFLPYKHQENIYLRTLCADSRLSVFLGFLTWETLVVLQDICVCIVEMLPCIKSKLTIEERVILIYSVTSWSRLQIIQKWASIQLKKKISYELNHRIYN